MKKCTKWKLWVKLYLGLNGEHSLGDSPSDSPGKLLLRGKGAVSVYVILVKGVCVQWSTHFGRTLPLVMRSRSLSTNEFSVFLAMRKMQRAFPSVSVVEDLPCSSGDTSSVSGPGRSHTLGRSHTSWSSSIHAQLLSICSRAWAPQLLKPAPPEPVFHSQRGRHGKRPPHRGYRAAPICRN